MAPIWVWFPNLPLNFWGYDYLSDSGNSLGKFHFKSEETKHICITTYAHICVDEDFNKEFLVEIDLVSKH